MRVDRVINVVVDGVACCTAFLDVIVGVDGAPELSHLVEELLDEY